MSRTKVIAIPVLGKHAVNAHLLLGRHPVLVDAGTPGSAGRILDAVTRNGVDPADLRLIVITHGHLDHFGSAAELHRLTGAPVAGHVADLGQYRTGRVREPYLPTGPMGRLMDRNRKLHETVEPFEPGVLLDGELPLHDFGVDARIMPTPGHTAGSVSVLTDDGDLVAGDLIANSFMGLVPGRPANPPFHDDPRRNLASLRAMLELRPTRLHVGHGIPLDPERVRDWATREQRRLDRAAAAGRLRSRPGTSRRPIRRSR
ncbi:MBL fold metallo-hydrolase [Kitasatospora sp. NBC_00240]|uniref:MBL fold metallo-hydrolase n=1 Tax=Kitasatospora sp. NBC_00240 TaxID=2903567 RepID=UPI002259ACBD|nr:MBL fold metallo-hydrolase [Kitasatospora sp. NBC_00240]MCX5215132.1 MBL fold metallo-hydrolase [Kitasatospora sp. NBC_00240]